MPWWTRNTEKDILPSFVAYVNMDKYPRPKKKKKKKKPEPPPPPPKKKKKIQCSTSNISLCIAPLNSQNQNKLIFFSLVSRFPTVFDYCIVAMSLIMK